MLKGGRPTEVDNMGSARLGGVRGPWSSLFLSFGMVWSNSAAGQSRSCHGNAASEGRLNFGCCWRLLPVQSAGGWRRLRFRWLLRGGEYIKRGRRHQEDSLPFSDLCGYESVDDWDAAVVDSSCYGGEEQQEVVVLLSSGSPCYRFGTEGGRPVEELSSMWQTTAVGASLNGEHEEK